VARAITVSVPDGLPLTEAERTVRELIHSSHLPIELKLSPAALGRERLAYLFTCSGQEYEPEDFGLSARDSYSSVISCLRRLYTFAREENVYFGLRIDGRLPLGSGAEGAERSFRDDPIFLACVSLASRVCEDMSGTLPIAFSGGLNPARAALLFQTGIKPLCVEPPARSRRKGSFEECTESVAEAARRAGSSSSHRQHTYGRYCEMVDTRLLRDIAVEAEGDICKQEA
jgi:hypothetical protein